MVQIGLKIVSGHLHGLNFSFEYKNKLFPITDKQIIYLCLSLKL